MDCKSINYKNIPVQSDVIAGILNLDVESNTCFRDLDSYVHSDQGVATLVLRVVNSALYSRGNKIATIPRAIGVLGFQVVRSLAMLAFSRSLFSQTNNPLFKTHIWQHSLLTAMAGQVVCAALGETNQKDEAFIAGLMHDMGKVLMFTHDAEKYIEVINLCLAEDMPSVEIETRLYGFDHYQVGIEAVSQWRLPERFIDYMGKPLAPEPESYVGEPVLLGLAVANCLIGSYGIGAIAMPDSEARRAALLAFGISAEICAPWLEDDFLQGLMDNDTYKLCANL
ncbi:MAG: HDOD domain-containing protein [Rhodocyclaceae bacterium]|nr:HDOD domain-containing protein [Rhodocyclaceae bacterium]